ncbi:hypothetical protein Anapl_02024 [Anas platyrhynchos]|uniref:Uncharacterized protein n=1 Tax=Anas platyrhynchos TaxID=8839 RepID=R0M086_ANAPL|nr:hypothetical protein Anapl_02024 [Anas platyrhynchos]
MNDNVVQPKLVSCDHGAFNMEATESGLRIAAAKMLNPTYSSHGSDVIKQQGYAKAISYRLKQLPFVPPRGEVSPAYISCSSDASNCPQPFGKAFLAVPHLGPRLLFCPPAPELSTQRGSTGSCHGPWVASSCGPRSMRSCLKIRGICYGELSCKDVRKCREAPSPSDLFHIHKYPTVSREGGSSLSVLLKKKKGREKSPAKGPFRGFPCSPKQLHLAAMDCMAVPPDFGAMWREESLAVHKYQRQSPLGDRLVQPQQHLVKLGFLKADIGKLPGHPAGAHLGFPPGNLWALQHCSRLLQTPASRGCVYAGSSYICSQHQGRELSGGFSDAHKDHLGPLKIQLLLLRISPLTTVNVVRWSLEKCRVLAAPHILDVLRNKSRTNPGGSENRFQKQLDRQVWFCPAFVPRLGRWCVQRSVTDCLRVAGHGRRLEQGQRMVEKSVNYQKVCQMRNGTLYLKEFPWSSYMTIFKMDIYGPHEARTLEKGYPKRDQNASCFEEQLYTPEVWGKPDSMLPTKNAFLGRESCEAFSHWCGLGPICKGGVNWKLIIANTRTLPQGYKKHVHYVKDRRILFYESYNKHSCGHGLSFITEGMFQSRPTNSESMPQWCAGKEVGVEKSSTTLLSGMIQGHCSWVGTGACAFDPWATELTKDVAALYGDIQSSSQRALIPARRGVKTSNKTTAHAESLTAEILESYKLPHKAGLSDQIASVRRSDSHQQNLLDVKPGQESGPSQLGEDNLVNPLQQGKAHLPQVLC